MSSLALVITADPMLSDEAARLAAAAGVRVEACADTATGLRLWSRAPMVLVGSDLLAEVASLRPPRRDGVYAVSWSSPGDAVFRAALGVGAETVLELPAAERVVTGLFADVGDGVHAAGLVVGVLGGSGGAGATTFAAALAQVGASRGASLLVDSDPLGPGLGRVLGLEDVEGVTWVELGTTAGRLGARALREALPHAGSLGLLGWPPGGGDGLPAAETVREVLAAARRGHDLVVVDLPRSPSDGAAALHAACDVALLVVRATVTGVASAGRLLGQLESRDRLHVVVRGRTAEPEAVGHALGLPVLAAMPEQRGLAASIDLGLGPVRSRRSPLARAAVEVLSRCHGGLSLGPTHRVMAA